MNAFAKKLLLPLIFTTLSCGVSAQNELPTHYVGVLPSFLMEPYDTIKALEVNVFPITYEYRWNENKNTGIQIRPILNYRFYKEQSGISQTGASILINRYLTGIVRDDFWLLPQVAAFTTYTYNQLDKINTITLGAEFGAMIRFTQRFSLSVGLQPGINYYPDAYSRAFVATESGFKSHFGVMVHFGWNF